MADQVPAVCDVLDAIERRDWERLRRLLHPDVHWTTAVEEHLHGPDEVIACLEGDPPPAPPAYHEQRDGRMIRWIDTPG
jgi:ketosteroid isomerase-like protein